MDCFVFVSVCFALLWLKWKKWKLWHCCCIVWRVWLCFALHLFSFYFGWLAGWLVAFFLSFISFTQRLAFHFFGVDLCSYFDRFCNGFFERNCISFRDYDVQCKHNFAYFIRMLCASVSSSVSLRFGFEATVFPRLPYHFTDRVGWWNVTTISSLAMAAKKLNSLLLPDEHIHECRNARPSYIQCMYRFIRIGSDEDSSLGY